MDLALRHLAGQPMTREEAVAIAAPEPSSSRRPTPRPCPSDPRRHLGGSSTTASPVDRRLTALIESDGPVAVTQAVVMEVLVGARDDRWEADLRRLMLRFELLNFDAVADFDGAARIYRRCRAKGITPRGMVDCMIAAVAWRRGPALLAHDADMDRVADVVGLGLGDASLCAWPDARSTRPRGVRASREAPGMPFDASALRRTSGAGNVPWRRDDVTLIWISEDRRIAQAQRLQEKRDVLRDAAPGDCLLLAWPGQWRQDIFLVDDREAALLGLEPPSRR